ncbi:MAG TPA: hypothetical protein PK323_00590 [Bacteroidia bacterium]|nr:hypothetical protein [Bacteroidia bacterium]
MKMLSLILFMHLCNSLHALNINAFDINFIRREFNLAIDNEEKANFLYKTLAKSAPSSNSLQYAYLGATEALLAKHSFNPLTKMNYVNSALNKLNSAVVQNKNDIEIRFMRFSVESELPRYLGISKHLEEDKNVIINGLIKGRTESDQYSMYKVFAGKLYQSKYCNKEEKILLLNLIATFNTSKS